MPARAEGRAAQGGYLLRFAATASLLVAGTLVLVLYVLPERYVLSSGFREGDYHPPDPSTPFEPAPPLLVAALPPPAVTAPPEPIVRGPAELFWERVLPLLEAGRYEEALPLFAAYLADHPGDGGARREYAITLAAAGYGDRAIPVLASLLEIDDDPVLRLLLARTLRDEGRGEEAEAQYAILAAAAPGDEAIALEWARALAWIEDYGGAERVLLGAIGTDPDAVALRVELARIYYFTNRLEDARSLLAAVPEAELAELGALTLRDDVVAALTPPPDSLFESAVPPPTLLERAIAAREADDFEQADSLFGAALAELPGDADAWLAYADFLQYELEDFGAALEALRTVERIEEGGGGALQYRMAQLEIWTDRSDEAVLRLERLLGSAQAGPSVPDVLALLGDLHRWGGRPRAAVRRYEAALGQAPDHARAAEGLALLRAELHRALIDAEQPGAGALAESFADTDEYRRFDLGGRWTGLHRSWVWSARGGARRVEGFSLTGGTGSEDGVFAEAEGARWWRWGTVRTAAHLGVQTVRSSAADLSLGASLRLVGPAGRRTDVRVDYRPAYAVTRTLQSVATDLREARLEVAHAQPLSGAWSVAVTGEVASLDPRDVAGADHNVRLQAGASVGRALSSALTVGLATRALRYVDAAPDAAAFPSVIPPAAGALYWDPSLSVSAGSYALWTHPLGRWWELRTRVNPGLSYIDERRGVGGEVTPDLSGSLAFAREGATYRSVVELVYGQGRFSGYRAFGVNLSFTMRGWFGPGGGR